MRSDSRRRSGPAGLVALVMVLVAPAFASAQLIPNLPIRRERTQCEQENPQYRQIRQEYWGYYPTCWQKFPEGWGCPSAERPDWAASKAKLPLDTGGGRQKDTAPPAGEMPADSNGGVKPPTTFPDLPAQGGNLFNDDVKPPTTKPDTPPGSPTTPPGPGAAKSDGTAGNGVQRASTFGNSRRGRGFISGLINGSR